MTFAQFLAIMRARWKVPAISLGVLLFIFVALALLLPAKYTAEGSVVVDTVSPDPINGQMQLQTPQYLSTQIDIIQSDRVARKVIKNLQLEQNQMMRTRFMEATEGAGDYTAWLTQLLQANLEVKPSRGSSVIDIAYTAADPAFASTMTNEFIRAYVETNLELRVEPAKQYGTVFADQMEQARKRLEDAQARLTAYQKEQGIMASDERLDIESSRLSELSAQLVALQSATADAVGRLNQRGPNSPDTMANPVVIGLKSEIARQESVLQEGLSSLGESHPSIAQTKQRIAELKRKLTAESSAVGMSAGASLEIARQREAQVRASLDAQRKKVSALKEAREESRLLSTDVTNAERAIETIQSRVLQKTLESQASQTNVAVLKYATAPFSKSSPKMILFVLQAIFLGLLIGIGLTLFLEHRQPKIRIDDDIQELIGADLIGHLPMTPLSDGIKLPIQLAAPAMDTQRTRLRLPFNSSASAS